MEVTIMLGAQEMRALSQTKRKENTEQLLIFIYECIMKAANVGCTAYNLTYALSRFKDKGYDQEYIRKTLEILGYQVILNNGELYQVKW